MKTAHVLHAGPAADAPPLEMAAPPAAAQTPSQAIVAAANEVVRVTDRRGRTIGFKRATALDRMRFSSILGPQDAGNGAVAAIAFPAFVATELDGQQLGRPNTRLALEGRIALLDEDGVTAVMEEYGAHFAGETSDALLLEALRSVADRFAPAGMADDMEAALVEAARQFVPETPTVSEADALKNG